MENTPDLPMDRLTPNPITFFLVLVFFHVVPDILERKAVYLFIKLVRVPQYNNVQVVQQRVVASRVPFFDMASVKSLRPKVETQHQKIRAFLAGAAMPTEKKKTAIETVMSLQRPRRVPYSYNIYTRDICKKKSNNTHSGRCICALKAMKRKHPTLRVKKYM